MVRKDSSPEQQKLIDYAFLISKGNKKFIYTLEGENGQWNTTRVHEYWYWCPKDGKKHTDYGMGISSCYHPEVTNDPKFFEWRWHIEEAWRLWSTGTPFYGKGNPNKFIYEPNQTVSR